MPTTASATEHLLTDLEVVDFLVNGYLVLDVSHGDGVDAIIAARLESLTTNPGDGLTDPDQVPELLGVIEHPRVTGALTSLLGEAFQLLPHRHWHCKEPGAPSLRWHQDGTNSRTTGVDKLLALYYPTEVTADMGPTIVVPGTHFRNAPTDRMNTYSNIRGQVPLTVAAGTVAITHYDLWHGTSANRTDRRRHMVKFLFHRTAANTAPTWNHRADAMSGHTDWNSRADSRTPLDAITFANPLAVSQTDHYKEREIRRRVWHELLGERQAAR